MTLNCTLKMVNVASVMEHTLHHNNKLGEKAVLWVF